MKISKLNIVNVSPEAVPSLLDDANIPFTVIGNVNWPEDYPYRPDASFRIAAATDMLLVHFRVNEKTVRARYGQDNQAVWTDSCVEFFSIPGGDTVYYNLECNCAGTILFAAGPARNNREYAPIEVTSSIARWSSLGRETFEERHAQTQWEVALTIPYKAFFKHHIDNLDGQLVKANFYKCGDELSVPHFISWHPVSAAKPDFHRPDCFGDLQF